MTRGIRKALTEYSRLRIFVEGADKSGKSTLVKDLGQFLNKQGLTTGIINYYPSFETYLKQGQMDNTIFLSDHLQNIYKGTNNLINIHDRSVMTTLVMTLVNNPNALNADGDPNLLNDLEAIDFVEAIIKKKLKQRNELTITIVLDRDMLTEDEYITTEERNTMRDYYQKIVHTTDITIKVELVEPKERITPQEVLDMVLEKLDKKLMGVL